MHLSSTARRPRARGLAAVITIAGLLVSAASVPAQAVGPGPSGPAGPAGPGGAAGRPAASPAGGHAVRLTLITGDVVLYQAHRDGRVAATVLPAPGRAGVRYRTRVAGGSHYAVPEDAERYVRAGVLDERLFDLRYLADNGYDDGRREELPVIVGFREPAKGELDAAAVRTRTEALPARAGGHALTSVGGAAVRLDKARVARFWSAATSGAAAEPGRPAGTAGAEPSLRLGLARIWLDAVVTAADERSNAQVGAPAAWAAGLDGSGVSVGVLDTGADAGHPDLAGRIAGGRNFVPEGNPGGGDPDDISDRNGHGTHVAATIAGSGAASGGRHRGVAPGGRLYVGKVLDSAGRGLSSTIIAGMEWQAPRARIVNMSLGGGATDGTDPMSAAVDALTERYGTLFVISAGNSGPAPGTVGAPGAATAALTVGAVDADDRLAPFSGRGPRFGTDFAVKPEITAPGVDIVSARAAGTTLGTAVDEYHTSASGTSMAAPHVAGAAAILAQRHPGWGPVRLKTALVAAAHRVDGQTSYEQGAGRLDVARAVSQPVVPDTASISAGFTHPYTGQQLRRRVTYHNGGTEPVTLTLAAPLRHEGGAPADDGMIRLDTGTLTVPAGGTAPVEVTIDPEVGASGFYSGALVATGPGVVATVPIGFRKGVALNELRVRVHTSLRLDRDRPNFTLGPLGAALMNDDRPEFAGEPPTAGSEQWAYGDEPGWFELTLLLPAGGVYAVNGSFRWSDGADGRTRDYTLIDPEVRLDGDTTLTFDLDTHARVDVATPAPSESVMVNTMTARTSARGWEYHTFTVGEYADVVHGEYWVTPSARPSVGTFAFVHDDIRTTPQVGATVRGHGRVELRPRYLAEWGTLPKFPGDRRYGLVTAADARAGRDVAGRVVVSDPASWDDGEAVERLAATLRGAVAGGAAGVLTDSAAARELLDSPDAQAIPLLTVDADQGRRARAALAGAPRPTIDVDVAAGVPDVYKMVFYLRDGIGSRVSLAPRAAELTEIEATYHGRDDRARPEPGRAPDVWEASITFAPEQRFSFRAAHAFVGALTRTEYYTTTGPDILWERSVMFEDGSTGDSRLISSQRGFARPTREREGWNEAILPTQVTPGPDLPDMYGIPFFCEGCRQGDRLRVRALSAWGSGGYADAGDHSHLARLDPGAERLRVYLDGAELSPAHDELGLPYYAVPAGERRYRVHSAFTDPFAGARPGTRVDTTWAFSSGRPDGEGVARPYACVDAFFGDDTAPCGWLPMIHLEYDLGLDAGDTAPAGRHEATVTARIGPGRAALSELLVWTSTDGGAHWRPARVAPGPGGGHRVTIDDPAAPAGTSVSIKARAVDRSGATVEQVIMDAYLLPDRG